MESRRVNDLRQRPEKPMTCALQIAKQSDYSLIRLGSTSLSPKPLSALHLTVGNWFAQKHPSYKHLKYMQN
jgi:hypothetical protein